MGAVVGFDRFEHLCVVGDGSPALVAGVGEGGAAADDPLAGMPYMALLMGRMKSRPPPEAMKVAKPLAAR